MSSTLSRQWTWLWTSQSMQPHPAPSLCGVLLLPGRYHPLGPQVGAEHQLPHHEAQQRMFFLGQLKRFNLPKTMMLNFYTAIIESILTSSITTRYAAATAKDQGRLQHHPLCREGDQLQPAISP
ncbi:hypothetical protein PBY51_005100 [Eleginops maclovinus]|uniref:Alkylated DNA repair protein AlkB homologue 8 N-terminal domain-containing protein n=1 Tax=Eleginops maclovinus TaxID=56733 RepID=A0AAN8AH86_ELEMC|nr:hypothetical protein PBY51_005100 [Eleginops maclovinus]